MDLGYMPGSENGLRFSTVRPAGLGLSTSSFELFDKVGKANSMQGGFCGGAIVLWRRIATWARRIHSNTSSAAKYVITITRSLSLKVRLFIARPSHVSATKTETTQIVGR